MRITASKPMAALRAAAMARIDVAAEAARLQFITAGAGQALEYQSGEAEARALLAAAGGATPDPAGYPFLAAEQAAIAAVGGAAPALAEVAALVLAQADAWKAVGSAIKQIRRTAKLRIEAATTPAGIEAAEQVTWPGA